MVKKRVDANDAVAINYLGMMYLGRGEEYNITKDVSKAAELFHRAAELGCVSAYSNLAVMYTKGDGVSEDEAKGRQYFEKAAMAGDVTARFNIGCIDADAGNFDRATKHWLISASFRDVKSVNKIKRSMIVGATKDQYAQALRCYKQYLWLCNNGSICTRSSSML